MLPAKAKRKQNTLKSWLQSINKLPLEKSKQTNPTEVDEAEVKTESSVPQLLPSVRSPPKSQQESNWSIFVRSPLKRGKRVLSETSQSPLTPQPQRSVTITASVKAAVNLSPLQALTVCEPYASAIICGEKRVENRWYSLTSDPNFSESGKWIVIQAGSKKKVEPFLNPRHLKLVKKKWQDIPKMHEFASNQGRLIGVAHFSEIVEASDRNKLESYPWANFPKRMKYCWVIDRVLRLEEPIKHRGYPRIWQVRDKEILQQLHSLIQSDENQQCEDEEDEEDEDEDAVPRKKRKFNSLPCK